jgi:hypothetical protein
MILPGFLFPHVATVLVAVDGRDLNGSVVTSTAPVAVLVPCAVQQDEPPVMFEGGDQDRRGSVAVVRVFFRPTDPVLPTDPSRTAVLAALLALKQGDSLAVSGLPNPLILSGPPWDRAGRGVVIECAARDYR